MSKRAGIDTGGAGWNPDWEERLQSAARNFNYPSTPDIASRVKRQLVRVQVRDPKVWNRRLAAWAVLLIVVILAGILASPPVRAGVLEWLQIGAIKIFLTGPSATPDIPEKEPATEPTPTITAPASLLDLAGETTLANARAQTDFPIRLPAEPPDLGLPDRVYLQALDGPVVILVWLQPDLPGQVRLSLHILGPGAFAGKSQPRVLQETMVHGQPALWVEGSHFLQLEGQRYDERRLVDGNVLIWTEENLTYRLETALSLPEAIRVAESLR